MNAEFNRKLVVEYSAVFDDEPKDLKTYLTGISRSRLLNIATRLLVFSNRKSKFEDHEKFLEMFFCEENSQFKNVIRFRLNALRQNHHDGLAIITPQASLQIFEFCFDHLTDEDTQGEAETKRNLFKAILYTNEQITEFEKVASESTQNIQPELALAASLLAQSFAYSEIINYEIREVLTTQIIKSIYLFEFLDSTTDTHSLLNAFLNRFNCTTWKDFLIKLLPLANAVINQNNETNIEIRVKYDEHFKSSCDFIDKLTLVDKETISDYDFRKIRNKPLYKISNGDYRIIFDLFVAELFHKGMYFKLKEINNDLGKLGKVEKVEKVKGDFRGFYCHEFSEKFLLYKILNSIFQNKYIELSGAKIKQYGIEAEPDYYIRKRKTLFLFESKDNFISAKIKSTYDFAQYQAEFQKKLYFEEEDGKITNKAVLQLAKNIERVLTKQFPFDINYKERSIYIYPIIISHDRQFNVVGLNVLVNYWFKIELDKLKAKGLFIDKVQPITIIDIDTFIFHQDLFRDSTIKLELVIDEYFKSIKSANSNNKRIFRDRERLEKFAKKTVIPFSNFLTNHVNEKKIWRVPKMLKEYGLKLVTNNTIDKEV